SPEKGAQLGFVAQGIMLVVSGVYYPVSVLPQWMQWISTISPATYALRGIRHAILDGYGVSEVWNDIWPLIVIGIVAVPLGRADFTQLDFAAASFDAITALYSIVHVPRDEQPALLERIARWLKPDGLFLASLSHVGGPDATHEWLGVEMFFSGFDADTNRRL